MKSRSRDGSAAKGLLVLPNIFKDNKASISERVTFLCGFPLRLSFVVCRISGVLLISALNEDLGVDFGVYSVG